MDLYDILLKEGMDHFQSNDKNDQKETPFLIMKLYLASVFVHHQHLSMWEKSQMFFDQVSSCTVYDDLLDQKYKDDRSSKIDQIAS